MYKLFNMNCNINDLIPFKAGFMFRSFLCKHFQEIFKIFILEYAINEILVSL